MAHAGGRTVEEFARRAWVRHALKTTLAVGLGFLVANRLHLDFAFLVPVFAFLLVTMAMPDVFRTWAQALVALALSWAGSALILTAAHDTPALFLAATLAWIFVFLLFASWYALPALLGTMMAAIGMFMAFTVSAERALPFYRAYFVNFFLAGCVACAVRYLVWPANYRLLLLRRLGEVYAHLEGGCARLVRQVRAGEADPATPADWAVFRPLWKLLGVRVGQTPRPGDLFGRLAWRCQRLNLRIDFLVKNLPGEVGAASVATRSGVAAVLERLGGQFAALRSAALDPASVRPLDAVLVAEVEALETHLPGWGEGAVGPRPLLGPYLRVLVFVLVDIRAATTLHNAVTSALRGQGWADELPAPPAPAPQPLLSAEALRRSTKMVLLMLLLLGEELLLGAPGSFQVAFFGTFFAGVPNLGRQAKTDVVGLLGLVAGIGYGVLAAFLTSHEPHLPLVLAFILLGTFAAEYVYLASPRFGIAGLQFGLGYPFAFLASPGPEWGTFASAQTRFWGLLVAGGTALLVHAFVWPVLPVRRFRELVAGGLRETGRFLGRLFVGETPPPPDLGSVTSAGVELLDDARFLVGAAKGHPLDHEIVVHLQEMDHNLEYLQVIVALGRTTETGARLMRAFAEDAARLGRSLEADARRFDSHPDGASRTGSGFPPGSFQGRFEDFARRSAPVGVPGPVEMDRLAIMARCLDNVARAAGEIARKANAINRGGAGG